MNINEYEYQWISMINQWESGMKQDRAFLCFTLASSYLSSMDAWQTKVNTHCCACFATSTPWLETKGREDRKKTEENRRNMECLLNVHTGFPVRETQVTPLGFREWKKGRGWQRGWRDEGDHWERMARNMGINMDKRDAEDKRWAW